MQKLILMLLTITSMVSIAQERPFCILNATTNPSATPSSEQIQSLPILNGQPDLRFINEWEWWMEPLDQR